MLHFVKSLDEVESHAEPRKDSRVSTSRGACGALAVAAEGGLGQRLREFKARLCIKLIQRPYSFGSLFGISRDLSAGATLRTLKADDIVDIVDKTSPKMLFSWRQFRAELFLGVWKCRAIGGTLK